MGSLPPGKGPKRDQKQGFPVGPGGGHPPSNILKGKQGYKEITFAAEGGKQTFLGKIDQKNYSVKFRGGCVASDPRGNAGVGQRHLRVAH